MSKINEYPQAAALNDTDLLVMDQVQAGTHSTKSVSISQIKDKATSGLSGDNIPIEAGSQDSISDAVGSLSTLTTTDKSSIVGAVNEVNAKTTYSTSETVVGKWTDGRIVYQRVFDGLNINTTADTWVDTGVARGEIKKIISGFALDAEQSFVCAFGFSSGTILINMPIARSALNSIIIRYVKAT